MLNCKLDSLDKVEKLVTYCRKFEEDIDVIYGRQVIDAKSLFGVVALIGNTVSLDILTDNRNVKGEFLDGLLKL